MDRNAITSWLTNKQGQLFRYKMDKFQYALSLLGNPEREVPVIHVAGTNGKGSTVAFLRQLFVYHGLKVGTFTSPHMETVRDRMCLDGEPISLEDFQRIAEQIYQLEQEVATIYEPFSYFETMTLMFFAYLAEKQPDVALVEVGIGGLHDVTNVVWPAISVITSIGLDHQEMLGHDLPAIAYQKAGIIKSGQAVVVGPLAEEALAVVCQGASEKQSPLFVCRQDFQLLDGLFTNTQAQFSDLKLGLEGTHQMENAALALQCFLLYMKQIGHLVNESAVREALFETRWAGRLERVSSQPQIYLDGAHNLPAIERLVSFIKEKVAGTKTILFSGLQRKDIGPMLAVLQEQLPEVTLVLTSFDHEESVTQQVGSSTLYVPSYRTFIEKWQETAQPDDFLLVTGSLYFISEVRKQLFTWKV